MAGVHCAIGHVLEGDARPKEAVFAYASELDSHASHLPAAAGLIRTLGLSAEADAVRDRALRFQRHSPMAQSTLAVSGPEDAERIRGALPAFRARGEARSVSRRTEERPLLCGRPSLDG